MAGIEITAEPWGATMTALAFWVTVLVPPGDD
jgi:hypothetical protein